MTEVRRLTPEGGHFPVVSVQSSVVRFVLMTEVRRLTPEGGLAQLGERLLCKQEVIGSIPLASTSSACSFQLSANGVEN